MSKPHVLGKYVYISVPIRPELKVTVDENTKKAMEAEFLKTLDKLEVWAVGEAANPAIKEGQFVLVDPEALSRNVKMVTFNIDGEEIKKALVLDYHIVHIWPE